MWSMCISAAPQPAAIQQHLPVHHGGASPKGYCMCLYVAHKHRVMRLVHLGREHAGAPVQSRLSSQRRPLERGPVSASPAGNLRKLAGLTLIAARMRLVGRVAVHAQAVGPLRGIVDPLHDSTSTSSWCIKCRISIRMTRMSDERLRLRMPGPLKASWPETH